MKAWYENYGLLWGIMVIGGITLVLQCMTAKIQGEILWDCKRPAGTKNTWLRSLQKKYEVCYELHIPVQDAGGFLERYLWEYRLGRIRLHTWENMGLYGAWILVAYFGVCTVNALCVGSSLRIYGIYCIAALLVLCTIFGMDLLLQVHAKEKMIRVYLLDYLENTLKPRYENQYMYPEEKEAYMREYFVEPIEESLTLEENKQDKEKSTMDVDEKLQLIGEVLDNYL